MEGNRRRFVVEEHITLLKETGSQYIGHIICKVSGAKTIANKLLAYFVVKSIDLTTITAIGGDGTAVDTGIHSVVDFVPINCYLPDITRTRGYINADHLYLLEICQAINARNCDENLAMRSPGKICHSRWMTTANSILRLYISTKNPTEKQMTVTEFVLKGKNVDLRSYQSLQGAKLELQRRAYDLIEWDKVSEPPVLKQISTDLLKDAIANPDIVETQILTLYRQMPCHTQASERYIKIVTEACSAVCGPERREGWIKNTLKSCKIMLIFNTKAEYRTK
ncbi:unnamed protein product [Pieris macdunnoughi]|uniref:Uncharacterized protein n=1 Tax=Pieris macdunnoughi TaxID=345717 RepID=A0A821W8R9_9NEOP|nr:unnamed protein product [Pieris macdunnoughi]